MTYCLGADSKISDVDLLFDRGFLLGDGVFETLRAQEGVVLWLQEHLCRMERHAAKIQLPFPWGKQEVFDFLKPLIPQEGLHRLRLVLTAGEGGKGYQRPDPIFVRLYALFSSTPPSLPVENLQLCPDPVPFSYPAKTLSGLERILRAPPLGQEWVMVTEQGFLTECTTANIFWVRGDCLETPTINTSSLAGLTRSRVIELAKQLNLNFSQGDYFPEVLDEASEIFLTGTVAGLVPVIQWKDQVLSSSTVFSILKKSYDDLITQEIGKYKV